MHGTRVVGSEADAPALKTDARVGMTRVDLTAEVGSNHAIVFKFIIGTDSLGRETETNFVCYSGDSIS